MKSKSICSYKIILSVCFIVVKPEATVNFEQQLRQELFINRKLNPISRPGRYHNDTMNIEMSCLIQSLQKLDPRTNVMKMTLRLELNWDNRDLAWNPRDYGGIETIQVKPSLIWTPHITLLNSAKKLNSNIFHANRANVRNTGHVSLHAPLTTESHCAIDVYRFPFDQHLCTLIFGSWTHDGTHINITTVLPKIYVKIDELQSNDFRLINIDGRRSTYRHTCCREVYSVALFECQFERRSSLYQVGILLPSALICLFTAGIFWLAPITGHRLKMSLILLISNFVLLISLGLLLPISSTSTPSIIIFSVHTLCFLTLSLILSMVSINLRAKHPSVPAPGYVQFLNKQRVLRYLCINTRDDEEDIESGGWLTLVSLVDRVSFIIYCISFLLLFILYLH